jgi:hypothetical protein
VTARVWLLRTPSHDRLVLAREHELGEHAAAIPVDEAGNWTWSDVTGAVREFIALNPEWVQRVSAAPGATRAPRTASDPSPRAEPASGRPDAIQGDV